jgi:hypothetical protein
MGPDTIPVDLKMYLAPLSSKVDVGHQYWEYLSLPEGMPEAWGKGQIQRGDQMSDRAFYE